MFFGRSNRFVSSPERETARPFTDAAVLDRDDLARTHTGPRMVDDWRQRESAPPPPLRPAPPSSPQGSHSHHGQGRGAAAGRRLSESVRDRESERDRDRDREDSPQRSPTRTHKTHDERERERDRERDPTGPGPGSYFPERAPQFRSRQGALSFALPAHPVKGPTQSSQRTPGPGEYFKPSNLLRSTFHRQHNKDDETSARQGNKAKRERERDAQGEADEVDPRPGVVVELERLSLVAASGARPTAGEHAQTRRSAREQLMKLHALVQREPAVFVWPPPPGKIEREEREKDEKDGRRDCEIEREAGRGEPQSVRGVDVMPRFVDSVLLSAARRASASSSSSSSRGGSPSLPAAVTSCAARLAAECVVKDAVRLALLRCCSAR